MKKRTLHSIKRETIIDSILHLELIYQIVRAKTIRFNNKR